MKITYRTYLSLGKHRAQFRWPWGAFSIPVYCDRNKRGQAAVLGLRYRQLVTLKRVSAIVIAFCSISIVFTALALKSESIMTWYSNAVTATCLLVSPSSYAKIAFLSRRNGNQINITPRQTVQQNITSYRNSLHCSMGTISKAKRKYYICLKNYRNSVFFFFNSSLNPIIFIWKMRPLRQAMRQTLQEISSWCKCT